MTKENYFDKMSSKINQKIILTNKIQNKKYYAQKNQAKYLEQ